jgi:hypothetical protein
MAMRRHDPLIVGVLFTWERRGGQGSFVGGAGTEWVGADRRPRTTGGMIGNLVLGQLERKIPARGIAVSSLSSMV